MTRPFGLHIVLLALILAGGAQAGVADDWQAGRRAFEKADYASALLHFRSARDAGLDTPAVHYNIAVVQYRLGQYADATATFASLAARFPQMRALAEYNQGLAATRLGKAAAARGHFLNAYSLATDDRTLRILASERLGELTVDDAETPRWTAALGMRAGHDSNVALRDETGLPAGNTAESPMLDLFGTLQSPLRREGGFFANASAYLVRNFDADDFDQAELRVAAARDWRSNAWHYLLGAQASLGYIGAESFDRKAGVHAQASYEFAGAGRVQFEVQFDDVDAADDFYAGVRGHRWVADSRYVWAANEHRVQLRYAYEANDREDAGVSPDRYRAVLDYRYVAESGVGYEFGFEYRRSEYGDLAVPRDEDLTGVRGALTHSTHPDWLWLVEVRSSANESTDPAYDYDRLQLLVGAMRLF